MSKQTTAPWGSWRSPITAESIAREAREMTDLTVAGDCVYWVETRPRENGRGVIVKWSGGRAEDLIPAPYSARSRVHEYGGAAFTAAGGDVYFSQESDQQLYRVTLGAEPVRCTNTPQARYADGVFDAKRGRLIYIRERHERGAQPVNDIVALPLGSPNCGKVLASGHDFYAAPRIRADGERLAWLAWDHPAVPWFSSELWVSDVGPEGSPIAARKIAGGPGESVLQPEWSPDGSLFYVSDRTGWWNLYRWDGDTARAVAPMEAEFAQAPWNFGLSNYAFLSSEELICAYVERGVARLAKLHLPDGKLQTVAPDFTCVTHVRAGRRGAYALAAGRTEPLSLIRIADNGATEILWRSFDRAEELRSYYSSPEALEFDGPNGRRVYGFFYPPKNPDAIAPPGEKPPLLVHCHGGPNYADMPALDLRTQYWTSRGFAVAQVNYSGSTGYGTEYRARLAGEWGAADVEDAIAAAEFLGKEGRADPTKMAITGASAGGYMTLCALSSSKVFAAGASYYGPSDLEALRRNTHKFESHYIDWLLGPYPEMAARYRERSPLYRANCVSAPVILFQGGDDEVTPPEQSEAMAEALRKNGCPFAYLTFTGERHGFGKPENIRQSLEAELLFYSIALLKTGLVF